ncbi:MAG: hypothetical protein E4H01_09145 [Lysobacterales bacterium]|nr:MAG: hypothetical protein E4H01_09145 [Xanthomonadales bacterium]
MANIVTTKLLLNGPRNAIVLVYLESDGATGELDKETLVDPVVDLGLLDGARISLEYVAYNFAGFDARLEFASGLVDNNRKWVLSEGTNHPIDLGRFGGLYDDSTVDGTGQLQITTIGFTSSTDMGSIMLQLRKY